MTSQRLFRLVTWATVAATLACAPSRTGSGAIRLTPHAERLSDETMARDLAVFGALERRLAAASNQATGDRRYVAARAREWLALGREAYERNDRSAFPEDMIVLAERDITQLETSRGQMPSEVLSSNVVFPNDVRLFDQDTWGKAIAMRKESGALASPDEIARAEAVLLRAGHPFLAGPACLDDAAASRQALDILLITERTRVAPDPIVDSTRMVIPDRPPPVPQPDSVRLPRRPGACDAPERMTGVPSSVHFALDGADLSPASKEVLGRAIEQLRSYPGVRLRLTGHTDPRATNIYNQALSQRRVDAVSSYLAGQGISADRISTSALGEERLLIRGTSIRDHARNRRVDIVYTLCDGSELVPDETLDDLQLERIRQREKEK